MEPHSIVSKKKMWSYASGDAGCNLILQSNLMFLAFYYTDVVGLSAFSVAVILSVCKLIDVVTDVVIGVFCDRYCVTKQKYRKVLLYSTPFLGLSLTLCFLSPFPTDLYKYGWAFFTLSSMLFFYSCYNIPYCAYTNVLTNSKEDRKKIITLRFIMAMLACLSVHCFTLPLAGYFGKGDAGTGISQAMQVWSLIAIILLGSTPLICMRLGSPSLVDNKPQKPRDEPIKNSPWDRTVAINIISASVAYILLSTISTAIRTSTTVYYFKHFTSDIDFFAWYSFLGISATALGVVAHGYLASRFNNRSILITCTLLYSLAVYYMGVSSEYDRVRFALINSSASFLFGITIPATWYRVSFLADYIGNRRSSIGISFVIAATLIVMKLGMSIASALTMLSLHLCDYTPHGIVSADQKQTINFIYCLLPTLFGLLAILPLSYISIRNYEQEL